MGSALCAVALDIVYPYHPKMLPTKRLDVMAVDVTKDDLQPHLDNVGGAISALGNLQPFSVIGSQPKVPRIS